MTTAAPNCALSWHKLAFYYFESPTEKDLTKSEEYYLKACNSMARDSKFLFHPFSNWFSDSVFFSLLASVAKDDDPLRALSLYEVCYCIIKGSHNGKVPLGEFRRIVIREERKRNDGYFIILSFVVCTRRSS